jgi:hypothetical protein
MTFLTAKNKEIMKMDTQSKRLFEMTTREHATLWSLHEYRNLFRRSDDPVARRLVEIEKDIREVFWSAPVVGEEEEIRRTRFLLENAIVSMYERIASLSTDNGTKYGAENIFWRIQDYFSFFYELDRQKYEAEKEGWKQGWELGWQKIKAKGLVKDLESCPAKVALRLLVDRDPFLSFDMIARATDLTIEQVEALNRALEKDKDVR